MRLTLILVVALASCACGWDKPWLAAPTSPTNNNICNTGNALGVVPASCQK